MKAPDSYNERMSEFQFEQPTEQDNNESKSRKTEKRTLLKKLWAGQKWSYSTDCNDFWRTFECFSSSASTNNKKEPKRKSWKNKAICCRCFSGPNNRPIVRPLNVLMFEVFFFFFSLSFFLSLIFSSDCYINSRWWLPTDSSAGAKSRKEWATRSTCFSFFLSFFIFLGPLWALLLSNRTIQSQKMTKQNIQDTQKKKNARNLIQIWLQPSLRCEVAAWKSRPRDFCPIATSWTQIVITRRCSIVLLLLILSLCFFFSLSLSELIYWSLTAPSRNDSEFGFWMVYFYFFEIRMHIGRNWWRKRKRKKKDSTGNSLTLK